MSGRDIPRTSSQKDFLGKVPQAVCCWVSMPAWSWGSVTAGGLSSLGRGDTDLKGGFLAWERGCAGAHPTFRISQLRGRPPAILMKCTGTRTDHGEANTSFLSSPICSDPSVSPGGIWCFRCPDTFEDKSHSHKSSCQALSHEAAPLSGKKAKGSQQAQGLT